MNELLFNQKSCSADNSRGLGVLNNTYKVMTLHLRNFLESN